MVLKSLDVLIGVILNMKKTSFVSTKRTPANVDIYILPDCPWSIRALKLLDSSNIK